MLVSKFGWTSMEYTYEKGMLLDGCIENFGAKEDNNFGTLFGKVSEW